MFATINESDASKILPIKWHAHLSGRKGSGKYYACNNVRIGKKRKAIFMHHIIIGKEAPCDHKDGDGLNNCRANLRECTQRQNSYNTKLRTFSGKTSIYKGVSWDVSMEKWAVRISGKYIGAYRSEYIAARIYDREAKKLCGRFAKTNFPY